MMYQVSSPNRAVSDRCCNRHFMSSIFPYTTIKLIKSQEASCVTLVCAPYDNSCLAGVVKLLALNGVRPYRTGRCMSHTRGAIFQALLLDNHEGANPETISLRKALGEMLPTPTFSTPAPFQLLSLIHI